MRNGDNPILHRHSYRYAHGHTRATLELVNRTVEDNNEAAEQRSLFATKQPTQSIHTNSSSNDTARAGEHIHRTFILRRAPT
ncbi:hypothetical protein G7K_1917-t1 [Saitoella complicata NRRL Y-17804]|uniref:Uncharacterized protein n=1 Tax=Saitoella complicata (strain BCRC 22490 / CBS 7301 / JCM 7358 / NBRC 10748 / NRRL Y-17804) TaxID=698492 RepID=A0A0E9ND37_SAICN|nr:hypothetical protein G7K_1917-t1 [Saitoella complicata NRRL Y-17804]